MTEQQGSGLAHGLSDEVRDLPVDGWLESVRETSSSHPFLDWITAVDELGRSDEFRVIIRLVDFSTQPARGVRLQTRVPRQDPHLPSCTSIFRGAAWHEREVHDFFGIHFDGGDAAPLLNHSAGLGGSIAPLRKDFVLAARAAQPWPGSKEPGEDASAPSRRRMAPPGVPDPSVWGDRDPQQPPATPDEIAAAVAGGRVRRRR
ncbi:NADH-quinone oxidoreductase subunit C [Luteococcus sp. Sow4_B9]|uniref:NADH-quinone oxidoreductase subunit C n=1 Tax=Luteococcus sp. Sow4_B9 TaxID=3438792 RepID=UPI003F9D073D